MLRKSISLVLLLAALVIAACIPTATPTTEAPAEQPAEAPTLRIAVLPVLNSMPLFVAESEGLFDAEGVNVELIPFDSALNRQTALAAGEVDGAQTDLQGVVLLAAGGVPIKAVRHDSFTSDFRYFAIVAGASSGITDTAGLIAALEADTAQIAISNNTIIEYLTTSMLRGAGYEPDLATDYIEVAAIPIRLEQLAAGTVATANLPEPLVTLASGLQGGTVILDDTGIGFVPTVVAFRAEALALNNGEAVRAFLRAYEEAVNRINTDPEAYRNVEVQVPDPIRATYTVPQFVSARVPTEAEAGSVLNWMVERGLIDTAPAYADIIDGSYLP